MKLLVATAGLLLLAGPLFAGSMEIIKQRAKDMRNQNNAQQGVPGYAPATAPQSSAAAPSTRNMAALQADLAAITGGSTVSEEQKQKMATDIAAAASGPVKPSSATCSKLASELATVFSEKTIPAASRARLVQELDAVLNPDKYPQARLEGIYADIPTTLDRHGVSHRQSVLLTDAVKTAGAECRGLKP